MAFYRVTIWQEGGNKTQGIRELDNANIDAATNIFRARAIAAGVKLIDIEAAMLSNHCTAVKEFRQKRDKMREEKQYLNQQTDEPFIPGSNSRKKGPASGITLGERADNSSKTNPT